MTKPTIDELIKFCQDQFKYHIDVINDLEHSTEFLAYQDMINLSRFKIEKHRDISDKFRAMEEYLAEYRDSKESSNDDNIGYHAVVEERERLKKELKLEIHRLADDRDYCIGIRNGIRIAGSYIDKLDEDFSKLESRSSMISSPEYNVESFKEELKKELKNSIIGMNADGDDEYCRGWRNGIREAGRFIDINDEDFSQFEPHKITPTEGKKVSEPMISYDVIDWCKMISDMFESSYSLDCYDEGNDTRVIDLNDIFHLMIKYVHNERSDENG